jgi:fructokinase
METWISGYSFSRDYKRRGGDELKPSEIMERARAGEEMAIANYESWIDRVGRGLSVVVNTLDPDIFVMGGGMSNIDELYRDLPEKIGQYTFSPVFATPIVRSKHGDSSGVRGAAWLWQ